MSPKFNPFATLPILVDGKLCGYATYVSGQHNMTVVFDVQCMPRTITEQVLLKTFGQDCATAKGYHGQAGGGLYYVARYTITVKREKVLRFPNKYMKAIVQNLVKDIQRTKIAEAEVEKARVHAQKLVDNENKKKK